MNYPSSSTYSVARVCNDKLLTAQLLGREGIPAVSAYAGADEFLAAVDEGCEAFPAVVKPRWGAGSIGVLKVADAQELRAASSMVTRVVGDSYLRYESAASPDSCVVVQRALAVREYGMDVMSGLDGGFRACSVRRKVAMRAGETDVAETVTDDSRFTALARDIANALPCPGNMDVDVFDDGGRLKVLEMNARFGGGYPFLHMAGIDLPLAIVSWLRGQDEPEGRLVADRPGRFMKGIELVRVR
jgi:carbamoyl-phosphate synthase large subunit